jgi:Histidine kinase-, DNA gyrase B-, and HSP90-like ATPase
VTTNSAEVKDAKPLAVDSHEIRAGRQLGKGKFAVRPGHHHVQLRTICTRQADLRAGNGGSLSSSTVPEFRFTEPGMNVEIDLEIDRSAPESLALLSVRDHGPGVPEDSLRAIFQPFVRINTEGTGGNGLGLAIAFEAIRLHRRRISATNLLPTGLEINIRLPMAYEPGSPSP